MTAFERLEVQLQERIRARVAVRHARWASGAGGDVLLVGDRPAPSSPVDTSTHSPFTGLGHSSLWLNLQLEAADIPEERLRWINAYSKDGHPTAHEILSRGWKLIVPLGGNARKWVEEGPLPENQVLAFVQHPQAWKRFHAHEPYPLIDALVLALRPENTPKGD